MPASALEWVEEAAVPAAVEAQAQPSSLPWLHASSAQFVELTISDLKLAESKLAVLKTAGLKTAGRPTLGSRLKAQTQSSPEPTRLEATELT
jgi:hypothetical protein